MTSGFWAFLPLAEQAQGDGSGYSSWITILTLWLPILAVFYLLLIRPKQRERAKMETMIAALKKNDRVITAGGIYGVVTNVHREADEVTVKVDETTNTKLRVTLGSIVRVLSEDSSDESSSK